MATQYPADLSPGAGLAIGVVKLASAYSGNAITVINTGNSNEFDVGFSGDELDTATLDNRLGGEIGSITTIYDQVGSNDLTQTTANLMPHITDVPISDQRAIIFAGGSNTGSPDEINSADISALGMTSSVLTIIAVLQPSSGMYCNQSGAPGLTSSGFLIDLISEDPITVTGTTNGTTTISGMSSVAGIQAGDAITGVIGSTECIPDGTTVVSVGASSIVISQAASASGSATLYLERVVLRIANNPNDGDLGCWQITDNAGLNILCENQMVQTNPMVLTVICDGTNTYLYQNEQVRSYAQVSSLGLTAKYAYVGGPSNPIAGANDHCFDGQFGAALLYGEAVSLTEAAIIRDSLYQRFSINPVTSSFNVYGVFAVGDSIPAGYKPLIGIYGYMDYLQSLIERTARFVNYAIPGSTLTNNPASVYDNTSTTQLFPLAVTPALQAPKLGSAVIIHAGGNDAGIGPQGASGNLFYCSASIGSTVLGSISTSTASVTGSSRITAGMYVFYNGLTTLTTVESVTSSLAIVLSEPAASSFTSVQFCSVTPSDVYNGIVALAQSTLDAATEYNLNITPIVVPILPRDDSTQTWIDEINTLVLGSTMNVANALTDPVLNTNPGPAYSDSAHLSALGHLTMAQFLTPYVDSALG